MQGIKRLFSGMQPTGMPTLGNYLGAFKSWQNLQNEYDCIYCIADMHSITIRQDPIKLRKMIKDLFTLFLAIGLDNKKHIIYCQSNVSEHAELAWILNCFTYTGELSRMTQFKDKSQKQENITAGLFNYPVLQTADILLYQTDLVPVGEDQRQHIELARNIAIRFNNIYGEVFKVPDIHVPKVSAKIMSLLNPNKKMSKSEDENLNNVIFLLEDLNRIANKIKKSVTDSDNAIFYDKENKPGVSNLLNILSAISKKDIKDIENEFKGIGYAAFKNAIAEAIVEEIKPIQQNFNNLSKDKAYIQEEMQKGAERARQIAKKTMQKVKKKIGFL